MAGSIRHHKRVSILDPSTIKYRKAVNLQIHNKFRKMCNQLYRLRCD